MPAELRGMICQRTLAPRYPQGDDSEDFRARFAARVKDLEAWLKNNQRFPSWTLAVRKEGGAEARLACFLNQVQKDLVHGRLSKDRRARLEQVPGISEKLRRWEQ